MDFDGKEILNFQFARYSEEYFMQFMDKRESFYAEYKLHKNKAIDNFHSYIITFITKNIGSKKTEGYDYNAEQAIAESILNILSDDVEKISHGFKIINFIQQRFEVSKKIYATYRSAEYRNGYGNSISLHGYLLFATAMAESFRITNNFSYFNTLVKINDVLVAQQVDIMQDENKLFLYCLQSESYFFQRVLFER